MPGDRERLPGGLEGLRLLELAGLLAVLGFLLAAAEGCVAWLR